MPAKFFKFLILIFAGYVLFWNLGTKPLANWDEARYGQIALEMLRNGDPINYYYNGEPEFWTAKPPLSIWAMVASYKIFGLNEWAVRLPATLAGVIALYYLFSFFRLYLVSDYAWAGVAVAITTKALVGPHISRSGDTDAFLLAGLFAFLFYYARFFRQGRGRDLLFAALALGLAFFAKGFAIGFYLPVGVFFLVYRRGWRKLSRPLSLCAVFIFLVFPGIWFFLVSRYGNHDTSSTYAGANAIEVMIKFDLIGRLTGAIDSGKSGIEIDFLPKALEIRFGIWWILLCFWALFFWVGRQLKWKPNASAADFFIDGENKREALYLSSVSMGCILFLLFVSVVKLDWYLAPILPFFCLLLVQGFNYAYKVWPRLTYVLATIGLALGVWNQVQYVSLDDSANLFRDFVRENTEELSQAEVIKTSRMPQQNEMLYLAWVHRHPIQYGDSTASIKSTALALQCQSKACELFMHP